MMKLVLVFLVVCISLPELVAQNEKAKNQPLSFEFKIAKQRQARDKKGNVTSEVWNYEVDVQNKSLVDVAALDVKYTVYISTETKSGASKRESTRTVSGESSLAAIARGNRSDFLTNRVQLKQSTKVERSQSKKRGGNQKKGKTQTKVTEIREKLDGIRLQLFLKGKRVGEYVVGDAAKRATARGKKK